MYVITRISVIFLLATCALSSCGADPAGSSESSLDIAGRYLGNGQVESLELTTDGAYECSVFNGMTSDGCATVQGAGVSRGSWNLDGKRVTFAPHEQTPDLLVDFASAVATRTEAGITLNSGGVSFSLKRTAKPTAGPRRMAVQWEETR